MYRIIMCAVPGALVSGEILMPRIYTVFAMMLLIVPARAATPDLQGIWARVSFPGFGRPLTGAGPVIGRPRGRGYAGDYSNPILKPQAAELVKKHGEIEFGGAHALSPGTECWPSGVPLILENSSMQIIQQPDEITILYSDAYEFRQVRCGITKAIRW
jgi:hypothetical protein